MIRRAMPRPDPDVLAVRTLAAVDVLAATGIAWLYINEIAELGWARWAAIAGGELAWIALGGVVIVPAIFLLWLGIRLWRFDRAAWGLQIGLGLPIAAFVILGLFSPL